jgi:hypothetical protein
MDWLVAAWWLVLLWLAGWWFFPRSYYNEIILSQR